MNGADGKPLKITQTIATGDYMTFGMCLLCDENGDKVELIEKDHIHKGAECHTGHTQKMADKWCSTYSYISTLLIECLRQSELGALAENIAPGTYTLLPSITAYNKS